MRADERYRPARRKIDDVRQAPNYYHANDVAVSPFTPIGQVAHMPEEGSVPIKVRRKPSTARKLPAAIPAGFLTKYNNQAEDEFAAPAPRPITGNSVASAPRSVAAMVTSIWGTLLSGTLADKLLTRKAAATSHRKSKYVGFGLVAAALIALLLAIGPVPISRIHGPGSSHGSAAGSSGTYTSNFVLSPSGARSNVTSPRGQSGGTGKATTPSSSLIDSNIIGGSGGGTAGSNLGGSINQVTQPVTGGSGGGSATMPNSGTTQPVTSTLNNTTTTAPPIPGVTQPQTVTVPGTNVNLGKPIVSTSPIGVTLN